MPVPPRFLAAAAAAGLAAAVRLWRGRHATSMEARTLTRRPVGPDGIIVGAEGITEHRHHAPAVLLLHGAGDSPSSLRYLADHLHAGGYSVRAPLLPGHGRTIREFSQVTADLWYEAAREELLALRTAHEWVAVVGLSMGGALAARLAADPAVSDDLPAIVLLAPYLEPPAFVRAAAFTSRGWGTVASYVETIDPRSIHDTSERERSLGYGVMTPAALRALVRTARLASQSLPGITVPTLMIQSRHDNRVPAAGAERAFARIGASDKRMVWREVGGHILTVDHGWEEVVADVAGWLGERGGA
ncbi:MAG: alpha/beta fold hydrolase [Gemmatimonadaceae bacterium]|nr:alpha/beta fold hydrolase [Gemmatimonadaceae bacterium]